MSSLWHSTRSSLDDSVALFRESLGKLKAAKSVDIAQVIEQLKTTAESARMMRELVWSELPEASWQSRGELDALVDKIQKNLAAKALEEQLRSRLLALASELERGTIVHRRAHRVQELNQLRDQAVNELRSQAGLVGAPQTLPGPQADQWIAWACGLQEPQDAESLQALRNGLPHLDDFVANLEPNMWRTAGPPTPEAPPKMKRPAGKAQPERSRVETKRAAEAVVSPGPKPIELEPTKPSSRRDKPQFPELVDELAPRALDSNTLTPNDATPPPTEEDTQKTLAQERALLAGMMGLVSDPVGHFDHPVELPFTGELYRETSATSAAPVSDPVDPGEGQVTGEGLPTASAASAGVARAPVSHSNGRVERPSKRKALHETIIAPPGLVSDPVGYFDPPVERRSTAEVFPEPSPASEIFFNIRLGLEERWREKKWMFLAIAAVLVLAALGAILWGSSENDTGTIPVTATATKPAELTPSNAPDKGPAQPAISAGSETPTPTTKLDTKEQPKEQPKPQEQSVATKPPAKAPPTKQASARENEVLRPPAATPRDTATVKKEKEEAPPNVATEMPASIPGVLPNGVPNSVANIVKNVPVAVPKIGAEKVGISSGVAQGLLIHQVTPQYPPQARQAHIQGTVVLQVVIGKDGAVQNLHVLSGHPMLNQAAMDAVKKWRYKPYRLNGEPVEADTQINVNFTLAGE